MSETSPSPTLRLWPWVGASSGLVLSVIYLALLYWAGVFIDWRGHDVTIPVTVAFGVGFAALGFLIGRMAGNVARARHEARNLRTRMLAQAATHARDLQAEKLDAMGRLALAVAQELDRRLDELPQDARRPLDRWVQALEGYGQPVEPVLAPVDIGALVGRAVTRAGDALSGRQLHLEERSAEVARALRADAALIEPVLVRLLRNAGDAAGPGGTIRVRAGMSSGHAWIEIADDGPGVPQAERERLFEPFGEQGLHDDTLGLATAARVIEALGGRLSLQQGRGAGEGGAGACFRVALPAHGAQAIAARGPS